MAYLGNSPLNRLYSSQAIALAQGQTAVNVKYTPGLCLVFKNGALLEPGTDYTATDGSVVTLANPASAGDVLQVISLAQFAVANALALSGGTLTGPLTGPASASEANAGLIKLATTALAQALTDDVTALTPKKLADAFKGANLVQGADYTIMKLPGGVKFMSGQVPFSITGDVTKSVTFPEAFLTKVIDAGWTVGSIALTQVIGAYVTGVTTTGMTLQADVQASPGATVTAYWRAWGI